jgi:HEAT repeat protein
MNSLVASLLLLSALPGRPDPPTDAAFNEQIRKLDAKNDRAARLDAVSWLNSNSREKNAGVAIPALERCIRDDPDREVRRQAVLSLGLIAKHQDRACPLAVVEALLDKEDLVRWQASECAGLFKAYAPGSVEVLLRGAQSEDAEQRSTNLLHLGRAAGKDPKALEVIQKARRDKVFDVRHTAHCALFLANDKLDEFLVYLIRLREEPDAVLAPVPDDAEAQKRDRAQRNLILIGSAMRFMEWSERRADELAPLLLKLLDDKSPVLRRGGANLIGATAVKVDLSREPGVGVLDSFKGDGIGALLPYIEPDAAVKPGPVERAKPPEPSKAALLFEKLKAEDRLRELRDKDPDRGVRDAARNALARLAAVKPKKE